MRQQGFHPRQCTARSKRSGERCLRYAARGCRVCRMHGANSRRGPQHPNFRHGRTVKDPPTLRDLLQPRPIVVSVHLFPKPLSETTTAMIYGKCLQPVMIPPDNVTVGDWMRALRTARRVIAQELKSLRDYVNSADAG